MEKKKNKGKTVKYYLLASVCSFVSTFYKKNYFVVSAANKKSSIKCKAFTNNEMI